TVLGSIEFENFRGDGVVGAIDVYSGGGKGGAGGNSAAVSGTAGGGGPAGSAGTATLIFGSSTVAAGIRAVLADASAAAVQSIGGGGGGGGTGRGLNVNGGGGAAGGNGGLASAQIVNGRIVADGIGSTGLLVQSIGGGGGVGGDAVDVAIGANLAVGGNGGLGGAGGAVNVAIGTDAVVASVGAFGDQAVLAQSIGGAGGKGGSAYSTGSGFLSMTVGGDGGTGATAADVTITNDGIVTSYGSWGAGLQAQSIGGGGGDGGAAFSNIFGIVPTAAVAIGGRGGDGGTGAAASISNTANAQVTTYGSNANALLAQSVGGGGGSGGVAIARAVDFTIDPRIPAVSISVGLGGTGGTGNVGGAATVDNKGFVSTAGEQAYAVFAQSVGGGGGIGGDSTAVSYSGGVTDDALIPPIAVSVALGASGGSGGAGGTVTTTNSGLILTLGTDSIALVAQSIGGGGGAGGAGDSLAVANDPEDENPDDPGEPTAGKSLGVSISVGGTGGTGGHGGAVTLANSGSIATSGDGADGFYAQAVGGGGGTAGGGVANAGGNTLTVAVGLGGSGGAGGDGGNITASNTGAIATRGADAVGVYAQSVGGGGGEAGKGASTSGGVDNVAKSAVLFDTIAAGFNVGADVTDVGDGLFRIGGYLEATKGIQEVINILRQPKKTLKSLVNKNLDLSLSIGGQGGAAGRGGDVALSNAAAIWTTGAQSDAIFAQSVGGGGGKGGTTSSTGSSYDDTRNQVALGIAGGGGAAGDGGAVTVTNAAGSDILVRGVLAFGIHAQSVGGGGGSGANSQDVNGSLQSLAIDFNGRDGAQGKGGAVSVTNAGSIRTQGKNGIGIVAQSVGGSGGLVRSMTTDMTFDPDQLQDNPQGRLFDIHSFNLSFGGGTNSQGDGGAVSVSNSGNIVTDLRNAHAIVAQSVGGGGGITVGGQLIGRRVDGTVPSPSTGNGNGGVVQISMTSGTTIGTMGDGAYGVFAQSVGGGGGFAGDMSNISVTSPTLTDLVTVAGNGNGGDVSIDLRNGTVQTLGNMAAGVLAQSVGGGGAVLAQKGELQIGSAGGTGTGGVVTVGLTAASIITSGTSAPAIITYTNGPDSGAGAAIVNIDATSLIRTNGAAGSGAGALGAAIAMLSANGNVVNNVGTITATNMAAVTAPAGALTVNNDGKISGNISSAGALEVTGTGNITGNLVSNGDVLLNNNQKAVLTGNVSAGGNLKVFNIGATITGDIAAYDILTVDNADGATITGALTGNNSVIDNSGTIAGALTLVNDSVITNAAGGTIAGAITTSLNTRLDNSGVITDTVTVFNGSSIFNRAGGIMANIAATDAVTIQNDGTINGTLSTDGDFITTGSYSGDATLRAAGASLDNSGDFSGSITAGDGAVITNSGTMLATIRANGGSIVNSNTLASNLMDLGEGTVTNSGNLSVKIPNGVVLNGSLASTDTGTLAMVWFQPDTRAQITSMTVSGTAAVAGTLVIQNSEMATPDPQTVISAAGGVTVLPSQVVGDSATISYVATRPDANSLVITATADYAAGAADLSETQRSIATHLNNAFVASDSGLRLTLMRMGTARSLVDAAANLSAISGQSLLAASAIRLEASLAQARALYSCPGFIAGSTLVTESSCAWFRIDGSWANRSAGEGFAGYGFDATSFTMGGQKEIRDGWFLVGSVSYQDGRLYEDGGLVRIRTDGVMAALSVKHQSGPLALGFSTSLGNAWMQSTRTIPVAGARARARFEVLTWGLHGRAAWRFGGPAVYLEPELQLAATFIDAGRYAEDGAPGFDLEVRDGSDWVFNIMPGARVGTRIDLSPGRSMDLFAGAGVDILRSNRLAADARFVAATGSARFSTSLETDDTAARLSAGLRFDARQSLEVRLQYDGRLSSRETWHGAQARLTWRF
ncbi:hypothetical protein, partial [Sandaracinobacter sp.]|uniref:hypothetical protein n=1 Tax=Sandaracinobacter sp. TaxID=2487581 RepID=UPI0035B4F790